MSPSGSPRISVLIPVYNGTNYLRQALDSALAQTIADFEVLAIDDGSTDGTWSLIQSYGAHVRGIHKENGGTSSALNRGIQEARGEYIAWLSHDDIFLPRKLERQLSLLSEARHLDACYSDYFIIDGAGSVLRELKMPYYPPEKMVRYLLQYMFINGCTVMIKRSCFEAEGLFDETLPLAHDADMWFRLLRHFTFAHIPEPLVQYRVHAGQSSQKIRRMRADAHEFWRRCLEEYPITDLFPELRGREHEQRAVAQAHNCLGDIMRVCHSDMSLARGQYSHSLRLWPDVRNRALLRALLLQFWLPNPTWVILRRFLAWRRQSSRTAEQDYSAVEFSNIVRCSTL